jgi:hypothetical protein
VPSSPNLDDAHVLPWVLAWVAHALGTDPGAVYAANVSYPSPRQLTGTDPLFASQVLFAPIFALTRNAVLGANLTALAAYPLAAFAMERLLRRFDVAPGIAWAAGLAFALGALRVPFNLNALAYPNLFLPWTALALTRLRDEPSLRGAAVVLLAFGTGLLAGLYAAILLAATAAVWGLFELARGGAGRGRFAGLALGAAVVAAVPFLLAIQPYLATRGGAGGQAMPIQLGFGEVRRASMGLYMILGLQAQSMGLHVRSLAESAVLIAAAVVAIAAWLPSSPPARGSGVRSLVPRAVVLWILFGVLAWGYPGPLAELVARTPLGSFRYVYRYVVIAELGLVLLLAAALTAVGARFGARAVRVATAALVLFVLWQRGVPFAATAMHPVAAFTTSSRAAYAEVGRVVQGQGGGALLELPIVGNLPGVAGARTLEPDAMLGTTLHWLPTPGAHLSYHAPQRAFFMNTVASLARPSALEELHDATHVRWLLLRPDASWLPGERAAVLDALGRAPGVRRVWDGRGGWVLFRVDREPRHEAWFATLASGGSPGSSVLGSPLAPIPDAEAKATVRIESLQHDRRAKKVTVRVRARNDGPGPWPVVPRPLTPLTLDGRWGNPVSLDGTVVLVARWYAVDASGARAAEPAAAHSRPLRRDVDPGEEIVQLVAVPLPEGAGPWELELHVEQVGGAAFTADGNSPDRRRVPPDDEGASG